jgi:hypothetical protein
MRSDDRRLEAAAGAAMSDNAQVRPPTLDQPTRMERVEARLRLHRAAPSHGPMSVEAQAHAQVARIEQIREDFGRATDENRKHIEASIRRLMMDQRHEQIARSDEIRADFHRTCEENLIHIEASVARNAVEQITDCRANDETHKLIETAVTRLLLQQQHGRGRTLMAMFVAAFGGALAGAGLTVAAVAVSWP